MCHFIPTKTTVKTTKLARLFIDNIYKIYGLPSSIVCDRNEKFDNHFWKAVLHKLDTTLNLSTVDHPQMDGQIERINQVLEEMLRAYISKKQTNWEECLPILEIAYNSAKHVTTGFSPFTLMYGYQSRSPVTMGFTTEKISQTKDFLKENFDMLRIV